MQRVVSAAIGALGWTGLEYGLHRFAMHELRGRGLASREHLAHHADVTYFSPLSKKMLSAAASTAVVLPASWRAVGRANAIAATAGLLGAYGGYEVLHRRAHTHPPRGRYGRWVRRSHLHHHFGAPMRNFGVTSPVWDVLARTYDDPGVVTVPRRMAPTWMLDAEGEVLPDYAGDYVVKGRRTADERTVTLDRQDAFANVAPQA